MKKKLTLNQAWTLCLKQWKWIIEQLDAGNKDSADFLKGKWIRQNGYKSTIMGNCFFCEYARQHDGCELSCPARLVNKGFFCRTLSYEYDDKPREFYKRIFELNKKRKKEQK